MAHVKPSVPDEPVKLRVKKGDTVEVLSGKDKGKRGAIMRAYPTTNKVVVEGVNIIVRHTKDRPSRRPGAAGANQTIKGGRIRKEAPLFVCKVQLVCPVCDRPTRVGYAYRDGEEKPSRRKYRVCKHPDCGKPVDK